MANDHFYCVFLNNEKISEQISWRIDTCPRRLDQQTQSFMDQFTYFRLFLDFCHLSCTSWNFIRPLPPTFQDSACAVHFVSTFSLSLLPAETLLISTTIYLSCIFHLHTHAKLTFFPGIIPLEHLFLKISKTHTLTHQGLEAHRRQKQLPVSLQTSPLSLCSIPPSLPSSSLRPLTVTVFPLSLAPLYDPPSFGRNCSRYFFSLSLVNVYPAWRFF